ncbi:11810_t:CDS:2 [Scutellospora calospora]|uniref:11810_t:CDS:1 n=1 Tax=Scutellospora calospora TaxID=85575 RepID=A0ACA9JYB3_9GLOM|nr:11810_t:CDS:2 [Scutellospora calospora]
MAELESFFIEYDENDLTLVKKNIPLNQKPHCEQKLRPKGRGRCIHVSEFLCEPLGHVYLTVEQHLAYLEIPNRYVTETLELLAEQLKQTIDVLEIALLSTIFVFAFNNSSSHGAFAEDALVASRMNVKYSGKQLQMHPGRLLDSTCRG